MCDDGINVGDEALHREHGFAEGCDDHVACLNDISVRFVRGIGIKVGDAAATECYGYIDFSLHFLLLPFLLSFYHLLIPLKSKSPFYISAIHFPQSWNLFY